MSSAYSTPPAVQAVSLLHSVPILPATGFLRLPQIVGTPADPERGIPAVPGLIPVSRSTWWKGVADGRYPQPVKIGERCTAWRVEEIIALIESAGMAA